MRRRGRGNNRKPSHHHHHHHHHQGRNQTFDSNGPNVRLRGTAHQIYEKYLTLGRDATASGDRIMSENYFQHADHYYRIILANQGPLEPFERRDSQEPEGELEANGFGQSDQPAPGADAQQAFGAPAPAQAFNGGHSQGTNLPGSTQPRENEGQQGGQGHQGFRRDRFNRRFRNDRQQYSEQGGDQPREGGHRDGDRREQQGREGGYRDRDRDRDRGRGGERGQRQTEDEAFEPPAFLKADRPANEPAPRDPFNRDDDQR